MDIKIYKIEHSSCLKFRKLLLSNSSLEIKLSKDSLYFYMNYLLNFKKKSYDDIYHSDIDSYVSHLFSSHIAVCIAAIPFTALGEYIEFKSMKSVPYVIQRTLVAFSIYSIILVTAIVAKKAKLRIKMYKKQAMLCFDIFYHLLAVLLSYRYCSLIDLPYQAGLLYYWGWWSFLVMTILFESISRWFLRFTAFMIPIIWIGIRLYKNLDNELALSILFELALAILILSYLRERVSKKSFIEKQKAYEESQAIKEIMDQSTNGIIVYDLQGRDMLSNMVTETYKWWRLDQLSKCNLERIKIQSIKNNLITVPTKNEVKQASQSII